jgi:hypothetical protein
VEWLRPLDGIRALASLAVLAPTPASRSCRPLVPAGAFWTSCVRRLLPAALVRTRRSRGRPARKPRTRFMPARRDCRHMTV